jgi:hypothetical protein
MITIQKQKSYDNQIIFILIYRIAYEITISIIVTI